MGIQLDIKGLRESYKRCQKATGGVRPQMGADVEKIVMTMAHDDHLLLRALSAFFADEANDAEGIFVQYVSSYDEHGTVCLPEVSDVREEIPTMVTGAEIMGSVDASKKMPIVRIYAGLGPAEFRFNPKSNKLSRIG